VPVLGVEIGGSEFVTMAGPCPIETELQLMATATMFAAPVPIFSAEEPSSRSGLPARFKDSAWKG
jgi:hypothetical protein